MTTEPPSAQTEHLTRNRENRNLVVLCVHQVLLRVAWIFKTESVIMPAFLDTIGGSGWLRGCLPVLNRAGQSIPPVYCADKLRSAPLKKRVLLLTTSLMSLPFITLAAVWTKVHESPPSWLPAVFLATYLMFFIFTGLNQLAFATVQGKLIRANRRGLLMGTAGILGSVASISCAWILLRDWLTHDDQGFTHIFAFTGIGFLVSGLITSLLFEPRDRPSTSRPTAGLVAAWKLIQRDHDLRKLVAVSMLFVTSQLLMPHYQALGREHSEWQTSDLMIWVIAQNAGAAFFSLIAGLIADRFGNRLALRTQILGTALTPLVALWLSGSPGQPATYWPTFFLLGTLPTTFKTLVNYTLELTTPEHHPHYISTLKLTMAVPFVLSPLVGLLIDLTGFHAVFLTIAVLTLVGFGFTFRLCEPRQRQDRCETSTAS
ncbi:MAG: MFS transporter [Planctomycetaceae bacterium]